jgi:hypothetical protein
MKIRNIFDSRDKKASLEMPFSWIFAIIAGSVIILMAIYATTKFIETSKYAQYSESAKNLGNLLNPVVNGVTSAFSTRIEFKKETRVYFGCSTYSTNSPLFGRQTIAFSEESGFLKKWGVPGANLSRYNKYIFSKDIEQGKRLFIFSKPFYAGYKVDDLVYITADSYCFTGTMPTSVREELDSQNPGNWNITGNVRECPKDSVRVCFGFQAAECNMTVMPNVGEDYSVGYVRKDGQNTLFFYDTALMYAAIFSSPKIYSCNINRLGNKILALGQIYIEKIDLVKSKQCNSNVGPYIENIRRLAVNLTSTNLENIYKNSKEMDELNCKSDCELYEAQDC